MKRSIKESPNSKEAFEFTRAVLQAGCQAKKEKGRENEVGRFQKKSALQFVIMLRLNGRDRLVSHSKMNQSG